MKRFLFSILFISASVFSSEGTEQNKVRGSAGNLEALAGAIAMCFRQCEDLGGRVAGFAISFDRQSVICECTKSGDDNQGVTSDASPAAGQSEDNSGKERGCW